MLSGSAKRSTSAHDEEETARLSAARGGIRAMTATVVVLEGGLAGKKFVVGGEPLTFGRGDENDIVLATPSASRLHAELRREAAGYVLYDRGSTNGTWVNGAPVTVRPLKPGDQIQIGDEVFRFDVPDARTTLQPFPIPSGVRAGAEAQEQVLRVTVAGGGPVGLGFALLLEHLMGARVAIRIYESRWAKDGGKIVWKGTDQGNARRQQVVTIQSRQFLRLPPYVQEGLFVPGAYTEMWPKGPDSIEDLGPRNVRIAYVEDRLLALANGKSDCIELIPERFDPEENQQDLAGQHVLAICEGARSRTLEYFNEKFGAAESSVYSLDGKQVQDMVLGLRVKSDLPDPTAVLLTVTQNRFLLNSLRGEGFLNMRLTDREAREAVGIDPVRQLFTECIQAQPCLLELRSSGEFFCGMHHALFLPALLKGSAFWTKVEEGLRLFGVKPENLTAVTGFRLDMVQRPRFTVELYPRTAATPGMFGFLLGDAANAIHFWPGRGLNSGLASAISLARCLAASRRPTSLRDADFVRHEAVMAMLQYRHKTRAWRQMVTTDEVGGILAIKDLIERGITEADDGAYDGDADYDALMLRLVQTRGRLESRIAGLPDDSTLRAHLKSLPASLVHTLVVSQPWDTSNVGGEEVDVEWLLQAPRHVRAKRPAAPPAAVAP
jgi:2-polyprenyl-6-methoxyphenol hydroxylase-like FAD-dependent oxidoreductase